MKELKGNITILGNDDGVYIEIKDKVSSIRIVKIKMSPEDFCQAALGRLANTRCSMEVGELMKVGKKMINKSFDVALPPEAGIREEEIAKELTIKYCPEGWEPDLYFNSQGSFFKKDGINYARSTIRTWVDEG